MQASAENPKILIGASIPRSGHHFLANMMTTYYGPDLYYCEYYTLPTCCRAVPCTRRGRHKIIYQKSHDRDFALRNDVSDALYLIQYRHPVPEALSDRELEMRDMLGRPSLSYRQTRPGYLTWLARKAIYYRKFHDKWIANKMPNAMYLDYEDLSANPKTFMEEIVGRTTGAVEDERLEQTVEKNRSPRSTTNFKPRVVEDSPYFDAELLAPFEAWVLEHCPQFNYSSMLNGSYEGSELYGLILMRDNTMPLPAGETKRFKVASELAPQHPEVQRRLAGRLLKEKRVDQATRKLERLIANHPYFPDAYRMLFDICADSGKDVPESVLSGNALIACAESADLSMKLGAAFGAKELWVNAVAAYALALAVEPNNKQAAERYAAAVKSAR